MAEVNQQCAEKNEDSQIERQNAKNTFPTIPLPHILKKENKYYFRTYYLDMHEKNEWK